MMEKMIFGRYIPGDSFVHKLDPRSKLLFVFIFIVIVFLANNAVTYGILIAFLILVLLISRIKLYFLINGLKPVLFLLVFAFVLQLLFNKEGDLLWEFSFIKIHEEGLRQGIFVSIRFLVLVFITTVLTLTTSPVSITDGIEELLNPLKKIKMPIHELALMMSIALRFIPTLMDETDKIMKAQMARGSDLSAGPIKDRIKAIVPLLVPLFVSAFKRAEDLATAMEVRGYRGGEGRTRYRRLKWDLGDTLCIGILVLITALLIYFRN